MGLTVWVKRGGRNLKKRREGSDEDRNCSFYSSISAFERAGYVCVISQFEDFGALEKL